MTSCCTADLRSTTISHSTKKKAGPVFKKQAETIGMSMANNGWAWLMASLPAAIGLLTAAAVGVGRLENHRIYIAGRLVFVAPLVGLLFSGLLTLVLVIQRSAQHSIRGSIAEHRARSAEERRRFLQRLDHELKNPLTASRCVLTTSSISRTSTSGAIGSS